MRALVLSGGGNRGPLEVGAIQVLFEHGIIPDMIVGSSAGALNGALLAVSPCLEQVWRMAELWRESGRRKVIRSSRWRTLWQLLRRKDHLIETWQMREFVRNALPPDQQCFGDLPIRLFVTIAHLMTHTLYVYGDDPEASIVDAVVTSSAVPGYFPPTVYKGEAFVDGGVISNLPLSVAIARGASEIWAIDLASSVSGLRDAGGAFSILNLAIMPEIYNNVLHELECALRSPGVTIHHVPIYAFQDVGLGNFTRTDAMLAEGARAMHEYLINPEPNVIHYPPRWDAQRLPPGPPGALPFCG